MECSRRGRCCGHGPLRISGCYEIECDVVASGTTCALLPWVIQDSQAHMGLISHLARLTIRYRGLGVCACVCLWKKKMARGAWMYALKKLI